MMKTRLMLVSLIIVLAAAPVVWSTMDFMPAAKEESRVGKIVETQTEGQYTYIKIDEDGKEVWLATQPKYLRGKVSPGEKIEYVGGIVMSNFQSRALERTFETIRFVSRIRVLNPDGTPRDESMPKDAAHSSVGKEASSLSVPVDEEIKRVENGKTVEEILTGYEDLKDKQVVLRAKVMKVSKNILKKNWVTLQDGTGSSAENKLLAISAEIPRLGDIVTVQGIVKTDVNLGSGYKYKVLLDEATFKK